MVWFGSNAGSSFLNWYHFPPFGGLGSVNILNECWVSSLLLLCGTKLKIISLVKGQKLPVLQHLCSADEYAQIKWYI